MPKLRADGFAELDQNGDLAFTRPEIRHYPDLTENQIKLVRNALLPASKEIIILLLSRLADHKRMENDPKKQARLFADYADMLFGVSEYALALAIFWFIENDASDWFPNVARLQVAIKEHTITGVSLKPENA